MKNFTSSRKVKKYSLSFIVDGRERTVNCRHDDAGWRKIRKKFPNAKNIEISPGRFSLSNYPSIISHRK